MPINGAILVMESSLIFFVKTEINNRNNIEKSILYQTNKDSLRVISFPNTPVNPAKNMAI
jgi:hypothetical protein